jgi:transposase
MITTKKIRKKIKVLDKLIENYNSNIGEKKRDYKTYEENLFHRTKKAILFFDNYIIKSINSLTFFENKTVGRPQKLSLEQKVRILLIQRLICKSNREMSFLLMLFSSLNKVDISYKTVERIYDDEKVILILQNIHNLIIAEKKVQISKSCGDGTGYVLSVKEHYASIASKIKDKKSTKKQKILFSFTLMDIEKRIYTAFGTSFKSEKDAFNKAREMLKQHNISLESLRLDRYYSGQNLVKEFSKENKGIKFYLIPKKNVTVKGSPAWKEMLKDFLDNTHKYFEEYFKRNQSESGFSEDKRRFGWRIPQKLENRINTSYFGIFTWHNLFWTGA